MTLLTLFHFAPYKIHWLQRVKKNHSPIKYTQLKKLLEKKLYGFTILHGDFTADHYLDLPTHLFSARSSNERPLQRLYGSRFALPFAAPLPRQFRNYLISFRSIVLSFNFENGTTHCFYSCVGCHKKARALSEIPRLVPLNSKPWHSSQQNYWLGCSPTFGENYEYGPIPLFFSTAIILHWCTLIV